jgi:hypothetical protein
MRWEGGIGGSDSFLGVRDEGSQAGVPPKTTCSGRGVEGMSGMDDGIGLDDSAASLIGRPFKYRRAELSWCTPLK